MSHEERDGRCHQDCRNARKKRCPKLIPGRRDITRSAYENDIFVVLLHVEKSLGLKGNARHNVWCGTSLYLALRPRVPLPVNPRPSILTDLSYRYSPFPPPQDA